MKAEQEVNGGDLHDPSSSTRTSKQSGRVRFCLRQVQGESAASTTTMSSVPDHDVMFWNSSSLRFILVARISLGACWHYSCKMKTDRFSVSVSALIYFVNNREHSFSNLVPVKMRRAGVIAVSIVF